MGVAHLYAAANALDVAVEVKRYQYLFYCIAVERAVSVKVNDVFARGV